MREENLLPLVNHLAEVGSHEEGLEQTVHVAGRALVAEAFEAFGRLGLFLGR